MQNPNQQYEAEKMPILPFGDTVTPIAALQSKEVGDHAQNNIQQHSSEKLPTPTHYHTDGSTSSPENCHGGPYNSDIVTEFGSWQPQATFNQTPHVVADEAHPSYYAPPPFIPPNSQPASDSLHLEYTNGPPRVPLSGWTIVPSHSDRGDSQWHPRQQGKRGPFRDAALRQETAYTRKIGCCIRCRMQRIRVSTCLVSWLEP